MDIRDTWARTSMTRRRRRPRLPKLRPEKLWAEFSFPDLPQGSRHRDWFSETLRSLSCGWDRAIGVRSCNFCSTGNCGMPCESSQRSLNASDWRLAMCPSKKYTPFEKRPASYRDPKPRNPKLLKKSSKITPRAPTPKILQTKNLKILKILEKTV